MVLSTFLAASGVACTKGHPAPAAVAAPPVVDLASSVRPELCAQLRARSDEQWRVVNAGHKKPLDYRDVWAPKCLATAKGAWAVLHKELVYKELAKQPGQTPRPAGDDDDSIPEWVEGRWTLAYVPLEGPELLAPAGEEGLFSLSGKIDDHELGYHWLDIQLLTDYDKDGVTELLATYQGVGEGWTDEASSRIVTVHKGAISFYPSVGERNIDGQADVDKDGLADLWTYEPFETAFPGGNGREYLRGPKLLLHARADGRFVAADAVTRRAAKDECPARPKRIVAYQADAPKKLDQTEVLLNIACARLYGVNTDALLAEIDHICGTGKKSRCEDGGDNVAREAMKKWARIEPPFLLDSTEKESLNAGPAKTPAKTAVPPPSPHSGDPGK